MKPNRGNKEYLIIEAALKVFKEFGFYEATISKIAETAQIGKGTVYEYFDSKKQLFEKSILYIKEKFVEDAREIIKDEEQVRRKFILLAQYHGGFMEEYATTTEILLSNSSFLSKEMIYSMMEIRRNIYNFLMDLIEEGIAKKEIRDDIHKKTLLLSLWGGIMGNYHERIFFEKTKAKDVEAESIINTIFEGIGKQ